MKKNALLLFFLAGAISMIWMSAHYFSTSDAGILNRKDISAQAWYIIIFRTHILFGIMAITVGPLQYITAIRHRVKSVHRAIGYLYTVSVLLSSSTGLLVAQFAMGGWITSAGFSVLAIIWFYTTVKSLLAARAGNYRQHMNWSYSSYALTFGAITQRILLLIPLLTSVPFMPVYRLSAWLPWLLNLSLAYLFIRKRHQN